MSSKDDRLIKCPYCGHDNTPDKAYSIGEYVDCEECGRAFVIADIINIPQTVEEYKAVEKAEQEARRARRRKTPHTPYGGLQNLMKSEVPTCFLCGLPINDKIHKKNLTYYE
jgi:transcription elongation factor Elf1